MTKRVLITGASRGIGRATAIQCGARGWRVVVNYASDEAAAAATVSSVREAGGEAFAMKGDVASEADVLALFDSVQDRFGGMDALVNNVGIVGESCSVADLSVERMRRMFDVNILGAFLCAREAARRLPDGGVIVNVSSIASRLGSPNEYVDYAASKGAVDSLTIGLAKELAPRNIRVNAVRPGLIDTDIHASGGQPDRAQRLGGGTPLGRPGTADEIANAILWFLMDESSYATGSLLDIGGGR